MMLGQDYVPIALFRMQYNFLWGKKKSQTELATVLKIITESTLLKSFHQCTTSLSFTSRLFTLGNTLVWYKVTQLPVLPLPQILVRYLVLPL